MEQLKSILVEIILREKRVHLRKLAKAAGEAPTTMRRYLNTLVKEGIVGYHHEGKNKSFYLKSSLAARYATYQAEIQKALLLIHKYPQLSVILAQVLDATDVPLVIVFGSYAKFQPKVGSDIDVYIETTSATMKKKIELLNSKLSVKIGRFDTKNLLVKEIIAHHVILRGVESFYEKLR